MAAVLAAAATNTKALWYLTRGTGLVALLLLTVSVVLGVLQVSRWATPRWPRFVTAALHRNVSLLACAFLAAHITTSVVDGFAPIRWLDTVVPFASPYRPVWLGLGAVATDLLVAVAVTSMLRTRLSYRVWRAVHWAAYACWPVALLHGLGTGSDSARGWALFAYAACTLAVGAAVAWRLAHGWARELAAVRVPAAVTAAVFPVAAVAFVLIGPMHPGWARRSGTPASLLARGRTPATSAPAAAAPTFSGPFSDEVSGTISQAGSDSEATVTIDGALRGSRPGSLRVVLIGTPVDGGGIAMRSSAVSMGPSDQPGLYRGRVVGLDGSVLRLLLRDGAGNQMAATVTLRIDGAAVSGTVEAT